MVRVTDKRDGKVKAVYADNDPMLEQLRKSKNYTFKTVQSTKEKGV